MQDAKVVKSNALIEASYRLSVTEQRIMLSCISQLKMGEKLTDQMQYSVRATDIFDLTDSSSGSMYKELEKAALRLKRREVWIKEKPNGAGKHLRIVVANWVQTVTYERDQGVITLRFNHDMIPYLNELTEQFTRYALKDVAKMTSQYGIRLFELLAQWQKVGHKRFELAFIRDAFMLEERYKLFSEFRRWVLEPAVSQINEHTEMSVSYECKKTGKTITHIDFKMSHGKSEAAISQEKPDSKKPDKAKPEEKPKNQGSNINQMSDLEKSRMAHAGESATSFAARLRDIQLKKQKEQDS